MIWKIPTEVNWQEAHTRVKETDRIDTTCRELEKLGCKLVEYEGGMSIKVELTLVLWIPMGIID